MSFAAEAQYYFNPDEWQQQLEPPLTLSENLAGVVRPGSNPPLARVDTLRDVFRALGACWRPPSERGYTGREITLRVAFKRNGEILGQPRVTHYPAAPVDKDDNAQREAFARSVHDALIRCSPLPFTEKLGGAVAGRLFVFRFSDTRPM